MLSQINISLEYLKLMCMCIFMCANYYDVLTCLILRHNILIWSNVVYVMGILQLRIQFQILQ